MSQTARNKEELGSLLKMFQSEYFTQDMNLYYLHKYFSNIGISDYLINQMYLFTNS